MTGSIEVTPAPSEKRIGKAVFCMSCAMMAAVALWYSGQYLFFTFPLLRDVWNSVRDEPPEATRFVSDHGLWLWLVLAASTACSLALAWRHPGRRQTLVLGVATLILTIALAWVVNRGVWDPLHILFRGWGQLP